MIPPVKRVVALLVPRGEARLLAWIRARARERWGEIEREAGPYPFGWTDYYRRIAPELDRHLVSFRGLMSPEGLADWKHEALALEAESGSLFPSPEGGVPDRRVNVDPGWIDGARLVLASTKDHAHRIYLRDGIFAEVTLFFRKGAVASHEFTFPDFRSGRYDPFLRGVRADWIRDVRESREEERP
jgi:hypothetical protein